MPLPACLLHCNGGHVEIGLAPRPINTTTAVGRARRACQVYRMLRIAGGGGGGRGAAFACAPPRAAGKGHGGHPTVARGGGGGFGIPMASPRALWHPIPARGRRSSGKWSLCQYWPRSHRRPPPPAPPGCPAAQGCGSGRNGRAIMELAGWHDIDIAPMDLPGACDVQKSQVNAATPPARPRAARAGPRGSPGGHQVLQR